MTHARLRVYVVELAKATLEGAADPVRLLPTLISPLLKAPLVLVLMAQPAPWHDPEACRRVGKSGRHKEGRGYAERIAPVVSVSLRTCFNVSTDVKSLFLDIVHRGHAAPAQLP